MGPRINVKRKLVKPPAEESRFFMSGAIIVERHWAALTFPECALYVVLRAKAWNVKVEEFWDGENAVYRKTEFYSDVARINTIEPLDIGGEYSKPFLHYNIKSRKKWGELAGFYRHDIWRRNRQVKTALEGLHNKQLIKIVKNDLGDILVFPLPVAGIWGT